MKKIVILTDPSRKDDTFIRTLRTLFPECDIEIHSKRIASSENISKIREVAATHAAKGGLGKEPS